MSAAMLEACHRFSAILFDLETRETPAQAMLRRNAERARQANLDATKDEPVDERKS